METDEDKEQRLDDEARADAKRDIAAAEGFIETLVGGLKDAPAQFAKPISREEQIATVAMLIHNHADLGGAILIGAVAIMQLAESQAEVSA